MYGAHTHTHKIKDKKKNKKIKRYAGQAQCNVTPNLDFCIKTLVCHTKLCKVIFDSLGVWFGLHHNPQPAGMLNLLSNLLR